MKVGLIGLGRMGEGMSRRMIKQGIEVHGYRNNYEKACKQFEEGYISGCTTSLESLVQVVHTTEGVFTDTARVPGIFMMVVPAETVEDTLNELLQFCVEGDIIIDHGNSNFKDSRRRAERLAKLGIQYLDCGTSGGVYGLERGYCLMVVQILQYKPALQSLGHSHQALDLPLVQTPVLTKHLPSMVGYIADQLEQVTL